MSEGRTAYDTKIRVLRKESLGRLKFVKDSSKIMGIPMLGLDTDS